MMTTERVRKVGYKVFDFSDPAEVGIFDSFARQRFKFNVKILPGLVSEKPPTSPPPADKTSDARPTYKEVFVAPSQSMVRVPSVQLYTVARDLPQTAR